MKPKTPLIHRALHCKTPLIHRALHCKTCVCNMPCPQCRVKGRKSKTEGSEPLTWIVYDCLNLKCPVVEFRVRRK